MEAIEGKVVVITGASSGIGEATARRLAQEGASVVLGARRADRLQALASELQQAGGSAAWCQADVTSRERVDALVQLARETFGPVDVLVNNAGLMPQAPLEQLHVDEWERMIDVNIKGVLYGIAAVLPQMKERGRGHVVNLGSVAGHVVFAGATVYCGTKFAVRAITEGLRQEAGPDVRVTLISPGVISTEIISTTTDAETRRVLEERYRIALPPRPSPMRSPTRSASPLMSTSTTSSSARPPSSTRGLSGKWGAVPGGRKPRLARTQPGAGLQPPSVAAQFPDRPLCRPGSDAHDLSPCATLLHVHATRTIG